MSAIVYCMTGAEGVCGGISTANKNCLRAAVKVSEDRQIPLVVHSFLETSSDRPKWLPSSSLFTGYNGSRARFSLGVLRSSLLNPLFVFDHVGLSLSILPLSYLGLCRTLIMAHGSEADDRMKASSRLSFKAARVVAANSALTQKRLSNRVSSVRSSVCHLGLSPDFIVQSLSGFHRAMKLVAVDGVEREIGDRMLLLVARMDETEMEKGHATVIQAVSSLSAKFPDVQVVFPGPGNGRVVLQDLAIAKGVASRVFFPGRVSNEELSDLYKSCYAFVMPSQQEGFGLVYLEAMSFGKACIGCINDGAEEVIENRETGILVRNTIDELIAALEYFLENPTVVQRFGLAGYERLLGYFTSNHHQERFANLLRQALS